MKKSLLTLTMLGATGLLISAVAQDMPGDNNPPPPPETSAAEAGSGPEGGNPPPPAAQPAGAEAVEMAAPAAATAEETSAEAAVQEAAASLMAEPEANGTVAAESGPMVIEAGPNRPARNVEIQTEFAPPAAPVGTNNPEGIVMNFRNAPLELVLNYLSDAAGFIIVLDTRVNGNVNVISSHPMTRDEAVDLLNSVLNKNGYAAIRNGRTLTIVDKNEAKTRNIPVKIGNVPEKIPDNAEIVTQIIPIRFVEARQLISDLTSFVSPQATVVANEAGNSIVITDTQSNIRHLTEIIKAIDNSAEAETEIRVFRLQYANPTDVATELASVFPSSSSGGSQAPVNFRGGGGRGGNFFQRMMGGGGNDNGGSSADRIKKATAVTAVADARIQAVIVTAPKDLMDQIAVMMKELDVASTRDQKVFVFKMENGDPQQAAQVLQNMFQSTTGTRGGTSASQNSALMQRMQNNATTTSQSGSRTSSGFGTGTTGGRTGGRQF